MRELNLKQNNLHQTLTEYGFSLDEEKQVWCPEALAEFAYNDGDAAEQYVLDVVSNAVDKSVYSPELALKMKDWPSIYHLTSRRSNLLRPFAGYLSGKRVLEIGCGCGAITRFLGESGAQVVSVEGSFRRAQIARQRCSDLTNVDVICAASDQLPDIGEFDVIMLIGVLEYARLFLGPAGQHELLTSCRQRLSSTGQLFVAIENKLGVKYLSGAAEDHVGQPMFGVNNSYTESSVATFGREELRGLLQGAGFTHQQEFLPLPDYKMPTDLITPLGWKQHASQLRQLAIESVHKDAQGVQEPLFSLEQAMDGVWRNNLAADLSNSFLFIASPADIPDLTGNAVAYHYSDGRLPQYNKMITVKRDDAGALQVYPALMTSYSCNEEQTLMMDVTHNLSEPIPFIDGESQWFGLVRLINRPEWTLQHIVDWATQWMNHIRQDAGISADSGKESMVNGKYNDAMPFNVLIDAQNNRALIDLEWIAKQDVPLGYVCFRGVLHSLLRLTSVAKTLQVNSFNVYTLTCQTLLEMGMGFTDEDFVTYWQMELQFMNVIQQKVPEEIDQDLKRIALKPRTPVGELRAALDELAGLQQKSQHQSTHLSEELEQVRSNSAVTLASLTQRLQALEAELMNMNQLASTRWVEIEALNRELIKREELVKSRDNTIHQRDAALHALQIEMGRLLMTRSWRITKPMRFLFRLLRGQQQIALQPVKQQAREALKTLYYKAPPRYREKLLKTAFKVRPSWFQHHPLYLQLKGGLMPSAQRTNSDLMVDMNQLSAGLQGTPGKVAVHCHIFYHDLIEEFRQHLSTVPFSFDVYVSVTTEEAKAVCERELSTVANIRYLKVVIVPNRGRDIAPMFAGFGAELKEYDFIGHIQSKKSLYNGGTTLGWREYLFNALFGSTLNVQRIFTQFMQNESLGIIYPQVFTQVPYAAFTWLANRADGIRLCNRMQIEMPESYFNFPAGSMFWARMDAMRPLFDLNLSWEDFPEEKGQTDGTTAHAIERLLGAVPTGRGFDTLIIKDMQTPSWSPFRLDHQYLPRHIGTYRYAFEDARTRIVAFDIFDTLLVRPLLNPDHTKKMVMAQLTPDEQRAYQHYRAQAEGDARNKMGRDIGMKEIYAEFTRLSGIREKRAAEISMLESNIEIASVSARPQIIEQLELARALGKKVILISDMFLSRETIETMLRNNNIIGWDKLYLSSERGVRKDTGELYRLMLEEENVSGEQVVMVGDNERSDLQLPTDFFGIRSVHILRANDLAKSLPAYQPFLTPELISNDLNNELTLGLIIRHNLNKIAEFNAEDINLFCNDPYKLGYNLVAPLILGFCHWLVKAAREQGVDQLFFLAREGKLIKEVYDAWAAGNAQAPKGIYLQVSRRTVNVPQINSLESVMHIAKFDFFPNQISSFFYERFGLALTEARWQEIYDKGLWQKGRLLEIRNQDLSHITALMQFLLPDILNGAQEEKRALMHYFKTCGFLDASRAAVVDVGYSGTIQKALNHLVSHPVHGFYFATAHNVRDGMNSQAMTTGCYVNEAVPCLKDSRIFSNSFGLEQLLSANDAQIAKYILKEKGELARSFKTLRDGELATQPVRNALQAGVMAYVKDAVAIRDTLYPHFAPSLEVANALYSGFIAANAETKNTVLEQLVLDDDYCGRGLIS